MGRREFLAGIAVSISFALIGQAAIAQPWPRWRVPIKTPDGQEAELYQGSYALIIGVSKYTAGYRSLPGVQEDVVAVKKVLEEQGFEITGPVVDPDYEQLVTALRSFIDTKGRQPEARLLIYFAGHGSTLIPKYGGEPVGYIVPADAPPAGKDPDGFRSKAISMDEFEVFARRIQAKHALFVFDSCFSGTIFDAMRGEPVPTHISEKTTLPVRQFITSGKADEEVPDASRFRAAFERALRGAAGGADGYLTGTQLGEYLHKEVINAMRGFQSPQHGKLRDRVLGQGDFVFWVRHPDRANDSKPEPPQPSTESRDKSAMLEISATEDDAEVILDGKAVGRTLKSETVKLVDLLPGNHQLEVVKDGFLPIQRTVDIQLGKVARVRAGLEPYSPNPGDLWIDPGIGVPFRYVPEGTFQMGSPPDEPGRYAPEVRHPVTLTRGYWLGETEITQAQWRQITGNNPSRAQECGENCPVNNLTWFDAVGFADALSREAGFPECYELRGCQRQPGEAMECADVVFAGLDCSGYRLPTEAEWERAVRAGTETALYTGALTLIGLHNGPELDPIAWYGGNSGVSYEGGMDCSQWPEKQKPSQTCGPHPVGQKQPNAWHLADMLGSVWEWCGDWQEAYPTTAVTDPQGPSSGIDRVLRGGSWINHAVGERAAFRDWAVPVSRGAVLGFRLARSRGVQTAE